MITTILSLSLSLSLSLYCCRSELRRYLRQFYHGLISLLFRRSRYRPSTQEAFVLQVIFVLLVIVAILYSLLSKVF